MRITYVTQYYPPHIGGLEKVAQKQARSAVERGHDVRVVTYKIGDTVLGVTNEDGVQVYRVRGCHFFDSYFGIPFVFPGVGLVRTIAREVQGADVVHIHDVFYISSFIAGLCARLYKKPFIVTQHVALVEHTNTFVMFVQKLVYGTFGKWLLAQSGKVIVYNEIVEQFLTVKMGVPKDKVCKVRNGVDVVSCTPATDSEKRMAREKYNLPQDKKLVLFVGRFVPKKGYQELFSAKSDTYDLVFVGSGKLPSEWYRTGGVHVLGEINHDDMKYVYHAVDLLAAPSSGELFTLVMQEAFAFGLPVVTTYEKEYEQWSLKEDGIVLCDRVPEVLKQELMQLVQDEMRMKEMGEYSRELAEQLFDWEKNIEEVFSMYGSLMQKEVVVTCSWDDGHVLDMKTADLMKKYNVRGTFYIAPENHELEKGKRLTDEQVLDLSHDFEVGAHTMTHRELSRLSHVEVQNEVALSKEYLEKVTSNEVKSFCYPRGKYTKEVASIVQYLGFTSARTVKRFGFTKSKNPFEVRTSVHTYDHYSDIFHILTLVRFNLVTFFRVWRHWDRLAILMFDRVRRNGGVFHVWGHSWELEDRHEWERLERVFEYVSVREGVKYLTNGELYND